MGENLLLLKSPTTTHVHSGITEHEIFMCEKDCTCDEKEEEEEAARRLFQRKQQSKERTL